MVLITRDILNECFSSNGFQTPRLNDKLYLHGKGIQSISGLDAYTGLKALYLQNNAIQAIEKLHNQKDLRTLFIQQNLIEKIDGLDHCVKLDSLDLSNNLIGKIEKLSHLKNLTRLVLRNNNLTDIESIEHITFLPKIQSLDIQDNRIDDKEKYKEVINVFHKCRELRTLYLKGNPILKHIPYYRKTFIWNCQKLSYLDDRPVFENERRRCNAWGNVLDKNGTNEEALTAEREMVEMIRREERDREEMNWMHMKDIATNHKKVSITQS